MYSHSVCWASLCRAARDLEGEVREVYTMVRVIHLENTKTKEVRKGGKYTHAHTRYKVKKASETVLDKIITY